MPANAIPSRPKTVAEQFERAHQDFANEPALRCGNRFWTFAEVATASHGALGLLAKHGARPGDRVVLFLENSSVLRILEHGILRAGLVRVALSPRLHAREVAGIAEDCTAVVVCCSPKLAAPLRAALVEIGSASQVIVFSDDDTSAVTPDTLLTMPHDDVLVWETPKPSDTAMLMYSSGTTGRPKGAVVTHNAWIAHTELALAQLPNVGPGDIVLAVAPMAHFGGSIGLDCASVGAATVTLPTFNAVGTLEHVVEYGVTILPLAPVMLKLLIEESPPELQQVASTSLRAIPYGGSPTDTSTLVSASARFPHRLVQYYGLSEALAPIASLSAADHDNAAASILADNDHTGRGRRVLESAGRVSAGVELRFTGSGELDEQALGRRGEIVVRSPVVTTGYWNRPDLTAAALDSDGWFYTGDLGELDSDGYLHLLNRKNDLIISGGFNVYPGEVEHVISSLHGVEECAVIGVPHPRWGEGVHALIVLSKVNTYGDDPSVALRQLTRDVLDQCGRHLAGFKKPISLEIISEIPRTSAGKVDRKRLKSEYLSRHDDVCGQWNIKM